MIKAFSPNGIVNYSNKFDTKKTEPIKNPEYVKDFITEPEKPVDMGEVDKAISDVNQYTNGLKFVMGEDYVIELYNESGDVVGSIPPEYMTKIRDNLQGMFVNTSS
jgi:hypothetical protein